MRNHAATQSIILAAIMASLICLPGCDTTALNGAFVQIPLSSDIQDTTAIIGGKEYHLPATAQIPRNTGDYTVKLTAPGFPPADIVLKNKLSGLGFSNLILGIPEINNAGSYTLWPEEVRYSFAEGKNLAEPVPPAYDADYGDEGSE